RLVHVLPRAEFRELRSDRNRYKITGKEQERLRSFRIGFVGLSVGQATAVTMALEGIGGHFRLADMDLLDLSNLNRLRGGVHDLRIHKAVMTARRIKEIDPYFDLKLFPEGITPDSIDRFLTQDGKLDLIVEECDDLFVKVRIRERARDLGIAVIMDTCDRGLIDLERFDRESDRPLFHGLTGDLDAESLKGLSTTEKVPHVLKIVGGSAISERGAASVVEIGESVSSFPQTASGVTLGAALAADSARRMLLGELNGSGRFYVDIERIITDEPVEDEDRNPSPETGPPPAVTTPAKERPAGVQTPAGREEMATLVGHGTLAPSAGNCQPWRFVARGDVLDCLLDRSRASAFLDFRHGAAHATIGAAVENIALAARAAGRETEVELFPEQDERLVARVGFSRSRSLSGDAAIPDLIRARVTNRKLGKRAPLDDEIASKLVRSAAARGARLLLLRSDEELDEVGRILGSGDRLQLLCKKAHAEMMSELRWSREEVEATRDGLDIASMEFSSADEAAVRIISSWPAMRMVERVGGGRALEKPAVKAIEGSSAVGLVIIEGTGRQSYVKGGRAMQQVWLAATAHGLAFHPMTGLCYLFARLERGNGEGFTDGEVATLRKLRERYTRLFGLPEGHAEVLMFRLSRAEPPTARSIRRRLEDVLVFE
ncbi:MAG: Rv1355c family protein, partial [Deltaproteobacteria bacterium]|nr:Rv1355c family protein [Deltaproteobacteria bacterium]